MSIPEKHVCAGNPVGYLHHAYEIENGVPKDNTITFVLETLPKLAAKYCKKGGKVIDVGSGPVVIHATSLSKYYDQIYMAEYQEEGRLLLKNWLKGEQMGDFDWTPYFKLIAKNEGTDDFKSLETRVRAAIKDVIPCDVHEPKCGIPPEYQSTQFDVVISFGVIGVNSYSFDEYRKALKNVLALLKPGGLFIYGDIVKEVSDEEEAALYEGHAGREGDGHSHRGQEGDRHSHGGEEGHGHSHGGQEGHGHSHAGNHDSHIHGHYHGDLKIVKSHGLGPKEVEVKKELTDSGLNILDWVSGQGISDWFGWNEFVSVCQK